LIALINQYPSPGDAKHRPVKAMRSIVLPRQSKALSGVKICMALGEAQASSDQAARARVSARCEIRSV
jgi:hypothetical protein